MSATPRRKYVKAQRCGVCGYRILDGFSLLDGSGYHVGFCKKSRAAIVGYVIGWWSTERGLDAFGMHDQARAEAWGVTPVQRWEDL